MLAITSLFLITSSLAAPVVGGTTAKPGAWPDAVAVVAPEALCTGTLVAPDVVLTAGHCIETAPFEVILGRVDLTKPGGETIRVKSARAYPHWQDRYDVGVLVLEHPAIAKPRAIASTCTVEAKLVEGAAVEVVGFGLTTKSGTGENTVLHQGKLAVDDARCTGDPACAAAVAPDGEFIAGGHGVDACFGDSGGPVYLDAPKGSSLVGVVSRGNTTSGAPCGNGGVYVRADKVAAWIESTTHRKLTRTSCAGAADGEDAAPTDDTGGCSAGGLPGLAIGALTFALRRRRSRS